MTGSKSELSDDKMNALASAVRKVFDQYQTPGLEPEKPTREIMGVEVFSTGTHNGITFTDGDLENLVQAFHEMDFRPAIKVGHVKEETGLPAYGYMANLRKIDNKLVADLVDIQPYIYNDIKEKYYERVSLEMLFNWKRNGKTYAKVITAIALLGVEIPGVAGLAPLQAFNETEYESLQLFSYNPVSGEDEMKEELAKLQAQIDALKTQNEQLEKFTETVTTERDTFKAQLADVSATLAAEKESRLQATLEAKVAGVKIPALKEHFKSLYASALQGETKVTFSDKGETPMETVIDQLVEEVNKGTKALFGELSDHVEPPKDDGLGDNVTLDAAQAVVSEAVAAYRHKNTSAKYSEALKAVLLSVDPKVRAAYNGTIAD